MYVAVKGGERAIERSWDLLAANRRGDESIAKLGVDQIREQLRLAVARVITEGSVYDEELAALAIKQAAGDLVEAIFLLRAYRTTLPRFGYTVPLDTEAMLVERRISATFKDIPGGQVLGGMYDYTQCLLDFSLLAEGGPRTANVSLPGAPAPQQEAIPRVLALLDKEGLIEQEKKHADAPEPGYLSREPLMFPVERPVRYRIWPARMRVSCWLWATPRSAGMQIRIRLPARFVTEKSPSSWSLKSWDSQWRSAISTLPSAR